MFHTEGFVIISSNKKIAMTAWRTHIERNWEQVTDILHPLSESNQKRRSQVSSVDNAVCVFRVFIVNGSVVKCNAVCFSQIRIRKHVTKGRPSSTLMHSLIC